MKSKMKVIKTRRKWWVLYTAHHSYNDMAYSRILAICKTKKEAEKLRDQNEKFKGASINHAPEYMNEYSWRGC